MRSFASMLTLLLLLVGVALLPLSCATPAAVSNTEPPSTPAEWKALLKKNMDAPSIPELQGCSPAVLAQTERGKAVLEWAATAGREIPETTEALYARFREAGERPPYEKPYFAKRTLLSQYVMMAWLAPERADLGQIAALLESILAERTWVVPAHERPDAWFIDLFASETASELAHTLLLLGNRLPQDLQQRVEAAVRSRVLDPYLAHANDYGWGRGLNNWTGVCSGSVAEAFLILERDPGRLAQALTYVSQQQDRFIEKAFSEDGACLEGIGYWNYGLLHFVCSAEMIRARTGGAVDKLAHPKIKAIATYPSVVALDRHVFASFADSHEEAEVVPLLAVRIAGRTGETALLSQMGGMTAWRMSTVLRNLLWWNGNAPAAPEIAEAYMPKSGLIKLVSEAAEKRLVLAAKAGNNDEPHNNNDIGSFILRIGGATYLCDPGAGLYSRDYFGPGRYKNIFTNSFGHSVPRINGELQRLGAQYNGVLEKTDAKSFRIRFENAYGLPALKKAERSFAIASDGSIVMQAAYASDGSPLEVEEAFITWLPVRITGTDACIDSAEGTLTIHSETGRFTAVRLEEECKANHKPGVLTRIALTLPPGAAPANKYTFRFVAR